MNFEKKINTLNLIESLEQDSVGRNRYIIKFLQILLNSRGLTFFSLDGKWGSGKTFFIKQIQLLIDYSNGNIENNKLCNKICNFKKKTEKRENDSLNIVNERMQNVLSQLEFVEIETLIKSKKVKAVYFNAWEHDCEEDPIVSLIYQFIQDFKLTNELEKTKFNNLGKNIGIIVKNLSKNLLKSKTGIDLDFNWEDLYKTENLASEIKEKEELKCTVNKVFDNLIGKDSEKVIVFIDELDRCKPEYALKLLERLRHYILDERIIVVMAINKLELMHIINANYGAEFSSDKYLDKFFDISLILPNIDVEKYLNSFSFNLINSNQGWLSEILLSIVRVYRFEAREIDRFLTYIQYIENTLINLDYKLMHRHLYLVSYLILPYAIGLYISNGKQYEKFIKGELWDEFEDFIKKVDSIENLMTYSFEYPENTDVKLDQLLKDLKEYYILFFNHKSNESIKIANREIYSSSFSTVNDAIYLLGSFSVFKEDTSEEKEIKEKLNE